MVVRQEERFHDGRGVEMRMGDMKLKADLKVKIVEFYFKKTDGTLRQAFGTLKEGLIGETKGTGRKPNKNLQVYWDTEKEEYRCFKKCNLVRFSK